MAEYRTPSPEFIQENRRIRMDWLDRQPEEIRKLVHAYGMTVVRSFLDCGMTKPKHIRHCVERVLDEFSPTRGTFSSQGVKVVLPAARPNGKTETE